MKSELTRQLLRDEGEVLYAYADSLVYLTIGCGRMIDKRRGGGITPDESDYLLNNDIDRHDNELIRHLPWVTTLDDARHGALVNMVFQLGINGLLEFVNTLNHIQNGEYDQAAQDMMRSAWADQTPKRSQRLADQIRTGEWQ